MSIELIIFVACLTGWLGALRWWYDARRELPRIFAVLLMSVWLYVSVMLVVFTWNPPLEILLFLGMLPVVVIAYGYRLYEHYAQREKVKNEEKRKVDPMQEAYDETSPAHLLETYGGQSDAPDLQPERTQQQIQR